MLDCLLAKDLGSCPSLPGCGEAGQQVGSDGSPEGVFYSCSHVGDVQANVVYGCESGY